MRIEGAMSEETKWVRNPAYDTLGPENNVYVDPRFMSPHCPKTAKECRDSLNELSRDTKERVWNRIGEEVSRITSYRLWSFNARHEVTDTRPTNITEGAD